MPYASSAPRFADRTADVARGGWLVQKLVAVVCALCLLIPFTYRLYTYGVFKYQSVAADGIVVKSLRGRDIGGRAFLEYKDVHGRVHEIVSRYKINWFFAPREGERVRVLFLPHAPEKALVDSSFHYLVVPLACMAVGIALLISAMKRKRHG
jgi:hypothetical protein